MKIKFAIPFRAVELVETACQCSRFEDDSTAWAAFGSPKSRNRKTEFEMLEVRPRVGGRPNARVKFSRPPVFTDFYRILPVTGE